MNDVRFHAATRALAVVALALAVAAADAAPRSKVALTFDDLPAHGAMAPGRTRSQMTKEIVAALRAGKAPAFGFINAKTIDSTDHEDVLRVWREAGLPLGNHAFSHMDLHTNPADAFMQDVAANEPALRTFMGDADWHWFRYPYLREGDTPDKYKAVRTFLGQQHYRVAQVTLSFDDYAYNDPYARCLAKNDAAGIAWLEKSYLARADDSLTRGQAAARTIFGRDIKHIMLLHIGGFETVMLPRLLDLLKARGFTLTTLEDASSDEAYRTEPAGQSWNSTFLEQLSNAKGVPRPPADNFFQEVAAVCR